MGSRAPDNYIRIDRSETIKPTIPINGKHVELRKSNYDPKPLPALPRKTSKKPTRKEVEEERAKRRAQRYEKYKIKMAMQRIEAEQPLRSCYVVANKSVTVTGYCDGIAAYS